MSLVQIQIVTWNSRPHLERLFRGIERQRDIDPRSGSGTSFDVVVIDNASTDGTIEWIEEHYSVIPAPDRSRGRAPAGIQTDGSRVPPLRRAGKPGMTIDIIRNKENRGFAAGHNQGFSMCEAPYVLVLNPDTEMLAGYLQEILRVMSAHGGSASGGEADARVAGVQGKLYRELPNLPLTPSLVKEGGGGGGIIDSCGLKWQPWGQVVDIGQNSPDTGNFAAQAEVFGLTGACALYRLKALRQVADKHGIFDERFGSYKEDVDLAWRLQRAGWKAVYTPKAVCWHGRGVGRGSRKSARIRYLSFRNHLLMLLKNVKVQNPKPKSMPND